MKTALIPSVIVLLALAASAFAEGRTDDVWDVRQGVVVTSTSGTVGGSSINDLFGGAESSVERETTIFKDGMPEGFVHFVEWMTAAPVTVDGFAMVANDDFAANKARGFSEFRLFAKNTGTGVFDLIHTYTSPRNPYGEHITVTAMLAPVVAQEFRAEFVQAGTVNGGPRVQELDGPWPIAETDGYMLPLKAKAKFNAGTPSKSKFTASGFLEVGSAPPAFGSQIALDVGSLHVGGAVPTPKGKGLAFSQNGFAFALTPGVAGSSRAPFKLKYTGDLAGSVGADGPLTLSYADGALRTVSGTPELHEGGFKLLRGDTLLAPASVIVKAKAKLAGGGRDAFSFVFAATAAKFEPTSPFGVRIRFGDTFDVTLPPEAFRRSGSSLVLATPTAGLKKLTIGVYTGLVTVVGKAVDLGAFADGTNVVRVAVTLGADKRAVTVRMVKSGTVLKY